MNGLRLHLEWRITLLTLLLLPAMLGLGFWQLQRSGEKAAVSAQWEQRKQMAPIPFQHIDVRDTRKLEYLPVELKGQFLVGQYFLLDNKIHGGKFGYEVLGILRLDGSGQLVLVNRGWIGGDLSRENLPLVPPVSGPTTLTGHVYVAPGKPYLLADQALDEGWPKRIQAIELAKLDKAVERVAGAPLFPYPIRIDAGQAASLTVAWQVVNISPEKHTGYAIQWFAMAAALFLLYILRSSNLWQLLADSMRKQH